MTLKEAREILGLELLATRRQIKAAYRRAARLWHPDRAPAGAEAEHRARMQDVNTAHQLVQQFLEDYQYRLDESAAGKDYQAWWQDRFATGVWTAPARKSGRSKERG